MAQGPKAPQIGVLNARMKQLDTIIDEGQNVVVTDEHGDVKGEFTETHLVQLRDICDWTVTMLENRRDYHKKRQAKTKHEMRLMEEALARHGVNVEKVKKDAENLADEDLLSEEPEDEKS